MSEEFDTDTGEVLPLPEYRPLYPPIYRRSSEVGELFAALAKAQGAIEAAERAGANPHFGSRYATLDAVIEASRKPLAENGLAIMQFPTSANDNISVTTLLSHASGQWFESTLSVKPVRWDAQGIGSAITYLRRYTRMSIIGIAPEDDDAEAAVGRPTAAVAPVRPVSRAHPAVAPDDRTRAEARMAYRKVQAYIDGAKTAESMAEIFDAATAEWSGVFAQEIELIRNAAPDSLSLLRERLTKRLERIAEADPFGLARVPSDETAPPEPAAVPPASDPPSPPMERPPIAASAEGTPLLYPERAEEKPAPRRTPRQRSERADD